MQIFSADGRTDGRTDGGSTRGPRGPKKRGYYENGFCVTSENVWFPSVSSPYVCSPKRRQDEYLQQSDD